MSGEFKIIDGISDIADQYDGFILDLWGVIHDGQNVLPGVINCLERLKEQEKRICLLSNAPRRNGAVIEKLSSMGVGRELYDHVLTSGEATYQALKNRTDPWYKSLGYNCYHIGPERDLNVMEVQGLTLVNSVEDAHFVMNTGVVDFDETLADYEECLQSCVKAKLPMICANPDKIVHIEDQLVYCAGSLSDRYEELGGDVKYHGKPYPSVYQKCFELLGVENKDKIIAIGDSMITDIAGAKAAGIGSILVMSGIHRNEIMNHLESSISEENLEILLKKHKYRPENYMKSFVW